MKLFLESKADVDKAEEGGATPLYIVSQNGKLGVVKCLVEDGKADVEKAMKDGYTPLYVVSKFGQ